MNAFLMIFLGGGLGSVLRYGVYRVARAFLPADFPWGTLIVNVSGGLLAGIVAGLLVARDATAGSPSSLFWMVGVLGGFTTFSAFSLDAMLLWQKGAVGAAAAYVLASVLLSILGVAVGLAIARILS